MADSTSKHHDYHLVNPSPWPVVGSLSAFVLALGAISFFHKTAPFVLKNGFPWLMALGFIGVLYTMWRWWADVVYEANHGDHTPVVQLHLRYGMIMFIASEVMFFVAWFWAYFDAAFYPGDIATIAGTKEVIGMTARDALTGGHWPPQPNAAFHGTFNPWGLPLVNTLILLTSGTTVTWAHHALLHNDRKGLKWGLAITIVLGMLFTACQAYEYGHAGFNFAGHIYGSTFFMATGFHGAHVLIGTIFLLVCFFRALKGDFTPKQHFGFEAAAWYWHFVDVVWLFLFSCIYVWGAGTPLEH